MPRSFEAALAELGRRMGRGVRVPKRSTWRIDPGANPVVVAAMPAVDLSRNLQEDGAAVPSFALCLAWWFEHFGLLGTGSVSARVELTGEVGKNAHANRALFLLHEYETLLPGRFTWIPEVDVPWPKRPAINAESGARDVGSKAQSGSEHALECAFTTQLQLADQFASIERIEGFRRQLPVGVFDGAISNANRWSPGGNSQIDLWAVAADGLTVHLFELKKPGNTKLGILPEAIWYARLIHQVRVGDFGGEPISGGGPNMDIVRNAKHIKMWLLVSRLHPLVEHEGMSPLEWFREGLAGSGLDLGILPFETESDQIRLRTDLRWPPGT